MNEKLKYDEKGFPTQKKSGHFKLKCPDVVSDEKLASTNKLPG
jgi:hypothetical protein